MLNKLILSLILISSISLAKEPHTRPVYRPKPRTLIAQIQHNNPNIPSKYAHALEKSILKAAKRYRVDAYKLSAILAQESQYQLTAYNPKTKDWGISQINEKTIENYHLNKARLVLDLDYSVAAGAMVLADFQRMYAKFEKNNWYSRYNSSKDNKRKQYEAAVGKYL